MLNCCVDVKCIAFIVQSHLRFVIGILSQCMLSVDVSDSVYVFLSELTPLTHACLAE